MKKIKKAIFALVLGLIAAGIGWAGYGGFIFGIPSLILGVHVISTEFDLSRTLGIIAVIFACLGIIESIGAALFIAILGV
jgi:hypothetical protein